jgi:hypothetical protein
MELEFYSTTRWIDATEIDHRVLGFVEEKVGAKCVMGVPHLQS